MLNPDGSPSLVIRRARRKTSLADTQTRAIIASVYCDNTLFIDGHPEAAYPCVLAQRPFSKARMTRWERTQQFPWLASHSIPIRSHLSSTRWTKRSASALYRGSWQTMREIPWAIRAVAIRGSTMVWLSVISMTMINVVSGACVTPEK